jgi:hypothetical protein
MPLFAATIFLSATLLFLVQPMVGKMLLPLAGGSSAVWNTCMVSFQAALLAGYLYSHVLTTRFSLKVQVGIHSTLALVTIAALPFAQPSSPPPTESTIALTLWLIQTIAVTVGLPFFVVSTTGPLLQSWFSRTDHPRASDPYFLYAASNIGSSLGLLGYPFLLESTFNIAGQSFIWAASFVLLAILLISCGISAARNQAQQLILPDAPKAAPEAITWKRRGLWIALSAVPSSLMIGVTQHISTDLAAVPLLWVIPLFLYLLTFTLAFSPRIALSTPLLGWITLFLVFADGIVLMTGLNKPFVPILSLHIATFFIAALMCHRRLADDRPSPARLTEFFFYVALGGVLGGIFNALIAPLIFTLVFEYPVALAACVLLRPWTRTDLSARETPTLRERLSAFSESRAGFAIAFFAAAAFLALVWVLPSVLTSMGVRTIYVEGTRAILAMSLCLTLALLIRRPVVSALPFLAVAMAGQYLGKLSYGDDTLALKRSFFGVHHVYTVAARSEGRIDPTKPAAHKLMHGTTLHGAQLFGTLERKRPDGSVFSSDAERLATTYYHPNGPVGDIMRHLANTPARRAAAGPPTAALLDAARAGILTDRGVPALPSLSAGSLAAWPAVVQSIADSSRVGAPITRVAIVGLGSGAMAAYAGPGDQYTYYEIDPAVRDIATDPALFTYITGAQARGAKIDIVMGDGRLSIAQAPDKSFGLIVLDAFSSDSIPVHLLTKEAVQLYLSKLRDDGIVAFHISNRYFDLRPVLLAHSLVLQKPAFLGESGPARDPAAPRGVTPARDSAEFMAASTWLVMANNPAALANFATDGPFWVPLVTPPQYLPSKTGRPPRKTLPEWTDDFSDVLTVFRWKEDTKPIGPS